MLLRFAGIAALAVLSTACTYRTQSTAHAAPVDYSDYEAYGQQFGTSPTRAEAPVMAAGASEGTGTFDRTSPTRPTRGSALGFQGAASNAPSEANDDAATGTVTAEAEATEYQEVEATPGTACYEAAVKAGITKGTCTLVSERKYVLVGE